MVKSTRYYRRWFD